MFWKRALRNLNRLRVKATLGFGLLLTAFVALCVFCSSTLMERRLRDELTATLGREIELMKFPYITGRDRNQRGREIPESSVTDAELIAIQQKFPGGELLCAFQRRVLHNEFRFFYVAVGDEVYMTRLEPDGALWSRLVPREQRLKALTSDFSSRLRREGVRRLRLRMLDRTGKLLAAAPPVGKDSRLPGIAKGFLAERLTLFDGSVIIAARSTAEIDASLKELLRLQGWIFLSLLVIAITCGWLLARRLLAGVGKVSEAALRISGSGDFDCRVSTRGGSTEITDLVDAFNTMNDNNRKLFNEVRSVTDNVAHELKTPLTRLRGAAEITLGDRNAGDHAGELAAVVSEECSEMLALINSLLEITRTESGLAGLNTELVELGDQLRRAHELFLPLAEDLHIEFSLDIPPDPIHVAADRLKLQRVFSNLIDNALKFSDPDGKVAIRLADAGDNAVVTVSDHGCGISEADLPHIFDRLFRCDASRSRPGSGLGLTLAAAIVRAHGGTIEAASSPGKGSTFTVTLPKARPECSER
ncbi:MAG: HAMP domain-containing histidine kinase [Lentisphaeria bacterium]|nr:HAMP domain-containing histidine kinase [Lentisphaeria bacterium]